MKEGIEQLVTSKAALTPYKDSESGSFLLYNIMVSVKEVSRCSFFFRSLLVQSSWIIWPFDPEWKEVASFLESIPYTKSCSHSTGYFGYLMQNFSDQLLICFLSIHKSFMTLFAEFFFSSFFFLCIAELFEFYFIYFGFDQNGNSIK